MRSHTLKNIPEPLYEMVAQGAKSNFRSLNQELLWRVQQSFDLEEAAVAVVHQAWIDEALRSGPAKPAALGHWDKVLKRGLAKGRRAA